MRDPTVLFADHTGGDAISSVIDETLRSLRVTGSLLLREAYVPPWSIAIPESAKLATLLGIKPDVRVIGFHLVEFGHCELRLGSGDQILLRAGEIAICFGGGSHHLSQGQATRTQSIENLLSGNHNIRRPGAVMDNTGAALLCGVFLLHDTAFSPLYAALPPLLHTTLSRPGELHNLSGVARLMADEIDRRTVGKGYVIERLLEVLCAEAIRAHIETVPGSTRNWLRGIKDPVVGRAIAAIHADPGDHWSVQRLASIVSMSPSRFSARFSEALGDAPMSYVTQWRMSLACRVLRTTRHGIDGVAAAVGYESPAAFSRAFKKQIGMSPAAWRHLQAPDKSLDSMLDNPKFLVRIPNH